MVEDEQTEMYRKLPEISDEIRQFVLDGEVGLGSEFAKDLADIGTALRRVDEELMGLADANHNLEVVVRGTVEGLYYALANEIRSEQGKAFLRALAYMNSFVLLRALDMQWRHTQPP